MSVKKNVFLSALGAAAALALLGAACGDDGTIAPIVLGPGGGGGGGSGGGNGGGGTGGAATVDPTDASQFEAPTGERLAFGVEGGALRNYFFRQGGAAAHVLTRSGTSPRLIAAFPAGNQGIGVWFQDVVAPGAQFWVGAPEGVAAGGGLEGVVTRAGRARPMYGVRATLESDAKSLTTQLALLANVRTLRDYGYGFDFSKAPELTNNEVELVAPHNVVRLRRTQVGGDYHLELLLKGLDDTTLSVRDGAVTIESPTHVKLLAVALSDEDPLTPIEKADLLKAPAPAGFELDALAFLTYAEKLQAGSWRFLTYFGRDTLLSTRLLMPALKPEVVEAALSSVVERVNLQAGLRDPNFDYTVDLGDVAHEEEIGDYAAWRNGQLGQRPADLRTTRNDYKMIDDDFLLAPVLVKYAADYPERAAAFFARKRKLDGLTYQAAVEKNLDLVLARARPYSTAADPDKAKSLVALRAGVPVGEWRDSDQGLGYGRYAFGVNAALVPAALAGAEALYGRFGAPAKAAEATSLRAAWAGVEQHFLVTVPQAEAKARVTQYAGLVSLSAAPADSIDADVEDYAISLDQGGAPVPVMHTDHGFVMLFVDPPDAYLERVAKTITRAFPAGLLSDVGVMVANPALAGNAAVKGLDGNDVLVRDVFTNSHYHGTVVWSWQQALLAAGVRRQLEERTDLGAGARAALEQAECQIWQSIKKADAVRSGELWTWEAAGGKPDYRFFGYNRNDVDESNAAQLWSTVYLAVKPPADFATRCVP